MQMAKYANMLTVCFAHSARRRDFFSSHRLIILSSTALRAMLLPKEQHMVTLSRVAATVAANMVGTRGAVATLARMAETNPTKHHPKLGNRPSIQPATHLVVQPTGIQTKPNMHSNQPDQFSSKPN